jgi:hypothetical protein
MYEDARVVSGWWIFVVHGKRGDPFRSLSEVSELGKAPSIPE